MWNSFRGAFLAIWVVLIACLVLDVVMTNRGIYRRVSTHAVAPPSMGAVSRMDKKTGTIYLADQTSETCYVYQTNLFGVALAPVDCHRIGYVFPASEE